jgi:hypothetical protein
VTETINDEVRGGDVTSDGTPHLFFLQQPHPDDCRHQGLTDAQVTLGKVFANVQPVDRGNMVSWLDIWSTTERATGKQTAVVVLRQAISDDDGYVQSERVRPIAVMLDPDDNNVDRFDLDRGQG